MTPETEPALLPLIGARRSVRTYDPTHLVSDADLRVLLEAARWAPSAGNSQPWGFLVGRRGDGVHTRLVDHLSPGNTRWAPRASVLLVTLHQALSGPEEDALGYSDYALYDLGQAVAQLSVQALAMGLAVHQIAGFDHDRLAGSFAVPPHWQVTTGVAIGRELAADQPAEPGLRERDRLPRERHPLAGFVHGERFGTPADFV